MSESLSFRVTIIRNGKNSFSAMAGRINQGELDIPEVVYDKATALMAAVHVSRAIVEKQFPVSGVNKTKGAQL